MDLTQRTKALSLTCRVCRMPLSFWQETGSGFKCLSTAELMGIESRQRRDKGRKNCFHLSLLHKGSPCLSPPKKPPLPFPCPSLSYYLWLPSLQPTASPLFFPKEWKAFYLFSLSVSPYGCLSTSSQCQQFPPLLCSCFLASTVLPLSPLPPPSQKWTHSQPC